MNSKTLLVIAGSTLALVGAATWLTSSRTTTFAPVAAASQQRLFPGLADRAGEVAKIVITRGGRQTVVVREGDGPAWKVESLAGYPAKFDALRPLVAGLAEATLTEAKTSKPDLYPRLEVEDASGAAAKSTQVTLLDAKGATMADLVVGKMETGVPSSDPFNPPPSDGVQRRYVRKTGDAQSWLARIEITPPAEALELVERNVLEIRNERVKAATITLPASGDKPPEVVSVSRASDKETAFAIANIPAGMKPKDEFAASRVAQALSYLTLEGVKPAAEINFAAPEAVKGLFECFDGTRVAVTLVEKDAKPWVKFDVSYVEPPAEQADNAEQAEQADKANKADQAATQATVNAAEVTEAKKAIRASVKKDADTLQTKVAAWAYQIPEFKATQLRTRLAELVTAPTPPATPEVPPPAAPNAGGSVLTPEQPR
ncbi:MAG: DUF4340 domain-containing protein [Phycisphaerae bacterium]